MDVVGVGEFFLCDEVIGVLEVDVVEVGGGECIVLWMLCDG